MEKAVRFPSPRQDIDDISAIQQCGLPRLLVINLQVPTKSTPLFGRKKADPGVSCVIYFSIKPETVKAALNNDTSNSSQRTAALNLWRRFVIEHGKNDDIRRRFKAIGIAPNFSELGLPGTLKSLNGKPVILFQTASIRQQGDVMQIDVAVHRFGFMALTLLKNFLDKTPEVRIKGGFLIQGEDDSELPECLLGSIEVNNLFFDQAQDVSDLLAHSSSRPKV